MSHAAVRRRLRRRQGGVTNNRHNNELAKWRPHWIHEYKAGRPRPSVYCNAGHPKSDALIFIRVNRASAKNITSVHQSYAKLEMKRSNAKADTRLAVSVGGFFFLPVCQCVCLSWSLMAIRFILAVISAYWLSSNNAFVPAMSFCAYLKSVSH